MSLQKLDIIKLIENNPIIQLNKIKENFNEKDQQIFNASFYCYQNFNLKNDFIIDFDNIWKWIGFSRKDSAKRLLKKEFILNIDYKILLYNLEISSNKEQIMITFNTFKKICLKASTKKADEIHNYYIKLEELYLKSQNNDKIESIIYIIKIKSFENGEYIIKIDESNICIKTIFYEHKKNYEECILLDFFLVNKSEEFKNFLYNHEQIKNNKVINLKDHENEQELFLINNNLSYLMIINIINDNINNYNVYELEKLKLENENNKINNDIYKLLQSKIELLERSNNDIYKLLQSKINISNQPLGPRLQCINYETLKLVKVYDSVSELKKENNLIKISCINKAISENNIYYGFRWKYINRELDPLIVNIEVTKEIKTKNIGYIAKINKEKSKILNVYLDKKIAGKFNGELSYSSLDLSIKNFTLLNGYYYKLYDFCDEKLKKNFENIHGKIILYKNGIGQFNLNNKLVKEFNCKSYCCKSVSISERILNKSLETNIHYNNYYYKYLNEKLKI